MICRVCKRELDSPVCSFCGEDNSDYMKNHIEQNDASVEKSMTETTPQTRARVRKYKIDYKKLAGLVLALALIVAAIVLVVRWFSSSGDDAPARHNELFSSDMLAVYANGEWGYIAATEPSGFAIEPQFRTVTEFCDDIAFVCIGGKYAIINKDGGLLTEPRYDSVGSVSDNGLIAIEENGKWGYIHADASYAITPKFSTAAPFSSTGVAAVSINGAYGYISDDGEYTIAPQYDMALEFTADGLAAIKTDDKWGYIDKEGSAVIEPHFEEAYSFDGGLATVKLHGDYGIINTKGEIVIEPQFDSYFSFGSADTALVNIGSRYGYIGKDGAYTITPRFTDLGSFGQEALTYAARGDGKYGFVDASGSFVIEPQFEAALGFAHGLAPVKSEGLWGYIDPEGSFVIEPKFTSASAFYDEGYAIATDALGKTIIINTKGNNILKAEINLSAVMSK
ncbi:MAG: WG repeat-containing protein [Clostridia bacterium]|nr:WG repeat-containing protein [Clostridia bacterium]